MCWVGDYFALTHRLIIYLRQFSMNNAQLEQGTILAKRYLVQELLSNNGGFGKTYKAEDTHIPGNPVCVVKHLSPKSSNSEVLEKALELFEREAEILNTLGEEHTQIPELLAYFKEDDGEWYLVQEFIEGHTLDREIFLDECLEEKEVKAIVTELLEILTFVHKNHFIHRDIKPGNIIRRSSDQKLVLIDFGAGKKVTSEGKKTVVGTPGYMPTEQLKGDPVYASDIYAVGMMAIQALTGIFPTQLPADEHTEEIIWRDRTKVSKVTSEFADILDKMVCENCRERYSSAKQVLAAIQQLNQHKIEVKETEITEKNEEQNQPINTPDDKPPIAAIVGGLVVTVLLGFGGIILFSNGEKEPEIVSNNNGVEEPKPQILLEENGVLDSSDAQDLFDKTYSDSYVFQGKKGQEVVIEMKSSDLDPKLILLDASGNQLNLNDDISPDDFNSRIVQILPADGEYTAIAHSSQPLEMGNYSLLVKTVVSK
jgi:serine/threonine protein kinase